MKKIPDSDGLSDSDIERVITSLKLIWNQEKDINNIGNILSPLLEMLKKLYKDDRKTPNNDNDGLYRKGICHGERTNFGNAKNSLKLILMLDRLIFSFMRFNK